jgi:dTDP-4-dehydrorhamnose reductase
MKVPIRKVEKKVGEDQTKNHNKYLKVNNLKWIYKNKAKNQSEWLINLNNLNQDL